MFTELLKLISQLGDVTADVLTEGAYWMWPILVRQQYVDALTQLGICCILSIVFIPWSIKRFQWCKNTKTAFWEQDRDRNCSGEVISVFVWIITLIVVIATIVTISEQLPRLLNPEYYAFVEAKALIRLQ